MGCGASSQAAKPDEHDFAPAPAFPQYAPGSPAPGSGAGTRVAASVDSTQAPDLDSLINNGKPRGRKNSFVASEVGDSSTEAPPIPATHLGFYSNQGHKSGRTINQDRAVVTYPLFSGSDATRVLLGVYDGHGKRGHKVSEAVAFRFAELMQERAPSAEELRGESAEWKLEALLYESLIATDDWLVGNRDAAVSGTTAITCVLGAASCVTACVGDSRAVLATEHGPAGKWNAVELSQDHKCDGPSEHARLTAAGGVVQMPCARRPVATIWPEAIGRGFGLSMSRSLGDHELGRDLIINKPTITTTALTPQDRCLILASDGVWEFLSSQEAVDVVMAHAARGATAACEALIAAATAAWQENEGQYRDDITAIVVLLPLLPAIEAHLQQQQSQQSAHDAWCGAHAAKEGGGGFSVHTRRASVMMNAELEHDAVEAGVVAKDRLSVYYGVPQDALNALKDAAPAPAVLAATHQPA